MRLFDAFLVLRVDAGLTTFTQDRFADFRNASLCYDIGQVLSGDKRRVGDEADHERVCIRWYLGVRVDIWFVTLRP